MKGNPSFMSFLPRALSKAREAFDRRPDLAELREILATHVPELGEAGATCV